MQLCRQRIDKGTRQEGNNAVRIMLIIQPIVGSGVGIVALEEAAKSLECT